MLFFHTGRGLREGIVTHVAGLPQCFKVDNV